VSITKKELLEKLRTVGNDTDLRFMFGDDELEIISASKGIIALKPKGAPRGWRRKAVPKPRPDSNGLAEP